MMVINAILKGKQGEREWAKWLREKLCCVGARRGQQYNGVDGEDVVHGIPNTHCEVKRDERLNINKAMSQAIRDSKGGSVPYVAHRKNKTPWLITVRAEDLLVFAKAILSIPESEAK